MHYRFIRRHAFAAIAIAGLLISLSDAFAASHTIHGRVTSFRTGLPVASAYVYARNGDEDDLGSTQTESDGRYAIVWDDEGASGSAGVIRVQASSYAFASATFDLTAADVLKDFPLRTYGTILGTVRNALSGDPQPSSRATLYRFDGTSWVIEDISFSGADGTFQFWYVPPDIYRVCAGGIDTGFARQCFNGIDVRQTGDLGATTPIALADGATASGIDLRVSEGGRITGTIRNGRTASAIHRTRLLTELYDVTGDLLETEYIYTSDTGAYELTGVPAGTHYLAVSPAEGALRGKQLYAGIACPNGNCAPANRGQSLAVSSGGAMEGIDFSFNPVATLEGVVTDRSTGSVMGGVDVRACLSPATFWQDCYSSVSTPGDGHYVLDLEAGKYTLVAYASESHVDTLYPDIPCLTDFCNRAGGLLITMEEGSHLSGRDFALPRSSHISGTIKEALTGEPFAWASVAVFDANYTFLWSVWPTNETGTYTTVKWPAGTYYVAAYGSWFTNCAFYGDRPCPPSPTDPAAIAASMPTPVVVADGETRAGIDIRIHSADYVFSNGFDP